MICIICGYKWIKKGIRNDVQRYQCSCCGKMQQETYNKPRILNEAHYTEMQGKSDYLGTANEVFVTGGAAFDTCIQTIRMLAPNFVNEANAKGGYPETAN